MLAIIHHGTKHRTIDIPYPAPEILILSIWSAPLARADHASRGRHVAKPFGQMLEPRALPQNGRWIHRYFKKLAPMIGDRYPEYEYVTTRDSKPNHDSPPSIDGLCT